MPTPQDDAAAALAAAGAPQLPQNYLARALETLRATGAATPSQPPFLDFSQDAPDYVGAPPPVLEGGQPIEFAADYARAPADLGTMPDENVYNAPQPTPYADAGAAQAAEGKQLADTAAAQEAAGQKRLGAQGAQAERQASAYEKSAADNLALNQQTAAQRAKIEAAADAETATWIGQMTDMAKREPNPTRWWDQQDKLGVALWGLALVFGARSAALTPGAKNATMEMVQKNLADDVVLQQNRMEQEMSVARLKGVAMEKRHNRNLTDLMDDHSRALGRLQALERAYIARAAAPGSAEEEAAHAEAKSWFEVQKFNVMQQRTTQAVAAGEAVRQRQFSAGQAAIERKFRSDERVDAEVFAAEQAALDRDLKRELSPVSISASYRPGGPIPTDKEGIPLLREAQSGVGSKNTTGAILVGPDGRPANGTGAVRFRKEDDKQFKEFGDITTSASQQYKDALRMKEILGDQSRVTRILAGTTDPEFNALIVAMGYQNALKNDPGGRITDKDFSFGVQEGLGFDPNGKLLSRLKFSANVEGVKALIDKRLQELPLQVNKLIAPLNDATINGQDTRIIWDPTNLSPPQLTEPNAREVSAQRASEEYAKKYNLATVPVTPTPPTEPPPTTVKDYTARLASEAAEPERRTYRLPAHDPAVVQDVIQFAEGRSPKAIADHARETLDRIIGTRPAGTSVTEAINRLPAKEKDTANLVLSMSSDLTKRAAKSVDDLNGAVKRLNLFRVGAGYGPLSADSIRSMAKKTYNLTDAEDVIQAAIAAAKAK